MTEDMQASTGELVTRLTEQTKQLVRDELRLAQVETTEKVKHGVMGVAGFGAGGVLAFYGVGVLLAAAVLGLAEALPAWAAALIVGAVVLAIAGAAVLFGKGQVAAATPVVPEQAAAGVKLDVETIKGGHPDGSQ